MLRQTGRAVGGKNQDENFTYTDYTYHLCNKIFRPTDLGSQVDRVSSHKCSVIA